MAKKKRVSKTAKKRTAKKAAKKKTKRQSAKQSSKKTAKKSSKKGTQKKVTQRKKPIKKSLPKRDFTITSVEPATVEASLGRCEWRYDGTIYCEDGISLRECRRKAVTFPGATIIGFYPGEECPT
jgi:hypothetical protein